MRHGVSWIDGREKGTDASGGWFTNLLPKLGKPKSKIFYREEHKEREEKQENPVELKSLLLVQSFTFLALTLN